MAKEACVEQNVSTECSGRCRHLHMQRVFSQCESILFLRQSYSKEPFEEEVAVFQG